MIPTLSSTGNNKFKTLWSKSLFTKLDFVFRRFKPNGDESNLHGIWWMEMLVVELAQLLPGELGYGERFTAVRTGVSVIGQEVLRQRATHQMRWVSLEEKKCHLKHRLKLSSEATKPKVWLHRSIRNDKCFGSHVNLLFYDDCKIFSSQLFTV